MPEWCCLVFKWMHSKSIPALCFGPMQVFIADIRNCQNKEQEKPRVDKELGKIRKKFASGNAITGAFATSTTGVAALCNCSG